MQESGFDKALEFYYIAMLLLFPLLLLSFQILFCSLLDVFFFFNFHPFLFPYFLSLISFPYFYNYK